MKNIKNSPFFITIFILILVFLPYLSLAQDALGQEITFNIESSYDLFKRDQLNATLIKISPRVYWYIENDWWKELSLEGQEEIKNSLNDLAEEFESWIYPRLTQAFGSEWSPGIDKDTRITVLIHQMKKESGGYMDSSDEYPKSQIPQSNEREMIYLNTQYLNTEMAKVFLAHEFVHLITFNQKNKAYNLSEDIWLNEARAEYSITFLGYNDKYEGSHLERRVRDFLDNPSDSLTEWREKPADYGVINLFIHYLVDHFGVNILTDSLKIRKTGIESLNAILSQQGFEEDFSQIFANWTIAVLINDCQIAEKYCYFNQNLKDFRLTPLINYLPFVGKSTLSVANTTKDWTGNWHKFVGGGGTLKLEFKGNSRANFKVPYILEDAQSNFKVDYLPLDENQKGEIFISQFGSQKVSLTIIPFTQNKISNFSELEPSYSFFWSVSTKEEESSLSSFPSLPPLQKPISQMTREEILARIAQIQALIIELQNLLKELFNIGSQISCQRIEEDLYFGLRNNPQVRCLQEFLKSQGREIYPEGLVTGNFLTLTRQAVIRFQEKYREEILTPLGLEKGTGYLGPRTRAKINQLLSF